MARWAKSTFSVSRVPPGQIGARTPYAAAVLALLLIGLGLGATITPAMAAAFQGLAPSAMGQATSAINVVQRVAGAIGSALLAVVLQQAMTARLPGFHGGIGRAASSPHAAAALAGAFGVAFTVSFGITLLALVPATLLPGRPGRLFADPNHQDQIADLNVSPCDQSCNQRDRAA